MFQVSIPSRMIVLSSILLLVIIASNVYLRGKIGQGADMLVTDERLISQLDTANDANKAFGDLKYWLLELGVGPRERTEDNVIASRSVLEDKLDNLEIFDPEGVAVLRLEVGSLMDTTLIAIESYADQQQAIGDSFLAKGLEHIRVVDRRLSDLVNNFDNEVAVGRREALADARRASDASLAVTWIAVLLGIGLTVLVVRSITGPLNRLMSSMTAIIGGDLDAEIPPAGRDEIGAMTQALALFRDSLKERQQLMADREYAETTKRQAEVQLSDAIESISEGFALYDASDRLVLSNKRFTNFLHRLSGTGAPIGKTFGDMVRRAAEDGLVPEAEGRVEEWIEERLEAHRNPSGPHLYQLRDGRWFQVNERKTRDGGRVAVYMDITELKQHEQELDTANKEKGTALRELNAVLDNIQYGILFMDENLVIRMTNRAYRDIWGIEEAFYTPGRTLVDDIVRTHELGLYMSEAGDFDELVKSRLASLNIGSSEPAEIQLSNGKILQYQYIVLPDGGHMATYFDITELKQTEEALRLSEERYALAVKGSNDGLWDWDTDNDRIYISPRFRDIAGMGHGETVLDSSRVLEYVHPDDLARHLEAMQAHLRGDAEFYSAEYRMRGDDGVDRWVLNRGIGQRDDTGHVYRVAGSLTDINVRKEAEMALRVAKEQAEAATRTKSQFLANVSHELRTPLNAIIGLAEMLREEAEETDDAELTEPLQRVVSAGRHLLHLINDLLDLTKIEAGRLDLHIEDFHIPPMVHDVSTTAEALAIANENELIVRCEDDLGTMHSDITRVRQILLNLLSNAFKFTEKGTVTLSVERDGGPSGDWLSVEVADTGIGMTEEQIGHLFQEFSPADNSMTRKYGGTGLGLAISRRLCQLLGGEITVESEFKKGTTFRVRLPVAGPSSARTTDA
jgi:PAS domain S-box-containing protein